MDKISWTFSGSILYTSSSSFILFIFFIMTTHLLITPSTLYQTLQDGFDLYENHFYFQRDGLLDCNDATMVLILDGNSLSFAHVRMTVY